jgi:RNA polymerase sigma factor for flagellar operon FliA
MAAVRAYEEAARRQQRDELILSHLDLVRHVVGRLAVHFPPGIDSENLVSAGVLGLVEAAHHFDPARGAAFRTFAYQRVRGSILDELRRNCPLPQHVLERVAVVRRAMAALPPPVSLERLAAAARLSPDETADALAAMRFGRMVAGEVDLDGRPDPHAEEPDWPLRQLELRQKLAQEVERLPEQQRVVLMAYYNEGLRLKEIGALMGLSESRVSRLMSAALLALRERLRAEEG